MLNKNKKARSFSFSKEDIDQIFSLAIKEDGFDNIDIKDVKYYIKLKTTVENDELTVIPELVSATVDFEAWEK